MHGNNDKGSYDSAAWMEANKHKPGGGKVYHNDPSKRDVYSGSNPKMFEPYTFKPDTKMQSSSASQSSQSSSASKSSSFKK